MSGKRRAAGPPVSKQPPGGAKPPRTGRDRVKSVAKWFLIVMVVGALLATGAFFYLYKTIDIPNPNKDFQAQTSFVYYADGKTQLGSYATQNRDSIPLDQIPQTMQDAVVAAENKTFWTDKGIDPKGILRAAFSNASGNSTQGASTITQQYVKILYLSQERTYKRKIKEAILSLKLQQQRSKSEILEGYLNTIYFGRGAYGVQAAAHAYFDEDAGDLTLAQSAVLASVLNNPTNLDPANGKDNKRKLLGRYRYVLSGMADMGTAKAGRAERAAKHLPDFPEIEAVSQYGGQRGFMLSLVKDELHQLGYSDEQIDGGGLRVTTTFTKKAMGAARAGVLDARPDGFSDKELHVAVASVEPGTGALRGFYGGQDYLQSELNWAVTGGAPGSTFKPFALATALKEGYSLKDTFDGNSPYYYNGEGTGAAVHNEGSGPDGLGNDYGSAVSLLYATEESINTAYADLTMSLEGDGPQKIMETAEDMGIPAWNKSINGYNHLHTSPGLEPISSIALGSATVAPVNMANAYATIANGGKEADVHVIDKVVGENGKTLWSYKQATQDAIDADVAADTSYALQQVVLHGTGTAAQALGRPAAGKTGTATNADDDVSSAWFVGYTPQLATAVMYVRGKGNEQLDGWLPSYFGAAYPARTWTAVMQRDMEGLPVESFPPAANLDGDAPEEGHAPYTPPPAPTRTTQAPPSRTPSKSPTTKSPTAQTSEESPTTETSSADTDPTCGLLEDCPTATATEGQSSSTADPPPPADNPDKPQKPQKPQNPQKPGDRQPAARDPRHR